MARPMYGDAIFWIYLFPMACITVLLAILLFFSGCTLSFQNISTHGFAEDLVDETKSPSNDVSAQLEGVPIP